VVASGLSAPLGIISSGDATGRLFIVEQTGQVLVLTNGSVLPTPFLDISSQVSTGGEQGLLGLAFHPQYACNGRFFVDYTDRDGNTVVAEYHVSATDPDRANPQPITEILHVDQPFPNHNGGEVLFGPDGMLYVGLGDGGSEGDPMGNGQRLDTLLGKLLRIDVDHPSGGRAYGIPGDNPFADGTKGRPEIDAYGLRNPWRFSVDRATGDLWIGDVGQDRFEEVDEVIGGRAAGLNFGWNRMEADHCYPSDTCDQTGLTLPVAEYDHSTGDCAVIGGYVYRGTAIPGLAGRYLFGDECSGRIRVLTPGPDAANASILLNTNLQLTSFGQDDQGELYVAAGTAGEILEIVATN
jgi:glucose/arabinose dehydrogenase